MNTVILVMFLALGDQVYPLSVKTSSIEECESKGFQVWEAITLKPKTDSFTYICQPQTLSQNKEMI